MSIIEDIQRRSVHIHWPQGIVPEQADLFAHNDIVIAAPLWPARSGAYRTGQVIMEPDPDPADHRTMDTVTPDGI